MKYPWHGEARATYVLKEDFIEAAYLLKCEPEAIMAVWEVEAAGQHFLKDDSVIRRFEPHHFPREHWKTLGFNPGKQAPWRASMKVSVSERERMLVAAYWIDPEAAMRATSWGAPQIMGFNFEAAGFNSATEMVKHMAFSASRQLDAFVRLIKGWNLASAMRARDWETFARRYNGSGKVQDYARKVESAYRRQSGRSTPKTLRIGSRGADVRRLQKSLEVKVDGVFGPMTHRAVVVFQTQNSLVPDGIVGAKTWEVLKAYSQVVPSKQESTAEAVADNMKMYASMGSGLSAVMAAGTMTIPDKMIPYLILGAIVLSSVALMTWVWRKIDL